MNCLSVVMKRSTTAKRFAAAMIVVLGGLASQQAFARAAGNFDFSVDRCVSSPFSWIGYLTNSKPKALVPIDVDLQTDVPTFVGAVDECSNSTATQVFWGLALLSVVIGPLAFALRHRSKETAHQRLLTKVHAHQRSYAQRQQRHAALGSYHKHIPPL
jgi:hypothetical protein